MSRVPSLLLVLSLVLSGCRCSEPTDEEILKERIDTTKVHLYLATKIAILKADQSEDAKAAQEALLQALEALRGQPKAAAGDGSGVGGKASAREKEGRPGRTGDGGGEAAAGEASPGAGGAAARAPERRELTAKDLLKLAKALYTLKKEGQELLESGDEKGMKPFLPLLFEPGEELARILDLNHEHALLLSGMFILKFHQRSPVPVPPEILLYEAWMTESEKLLPGLRGFVRMEKAVVYGGNELCDLAAKEAEGAEANQAELEEVLRVMTVAGAKQDAFAAEQLDQLNACVRAIAHGMSAYCYQQREEKEKAVDELDATLQALEDAGVPAGETALLRAYVAMQRDDHKLAREHLERARDWKGTDPATKKDIESMLEQIEEDPNVFEKKLGKGWFNFYLLKIVLRHLDEAGVFDELKETELVKTLDGYVRTASEVTGKAKGILSGEGLEEGAKGVMDGVKGLLGD